MAQEFDPAAATAAYLAQVPPEAHAKAVAYTQGGHWLLLWGALVAVLTVDRGPVAVAVPVTVLDPRTALPTLPAIGRARGDAVGVDERIEVVGIPVSSHVMLPIGRRDVGASEMSGSAGRSTPTAVTPGVPGGSLSPCPRIRTSDMDAAAPIYRDFNDGHSRAGQRGCAQMWRRLVTTRKRFATNAASV